MNLTEDPQFTPGPNSPAWLAAMGEADEYVERQLEREEYARFMESKRQFADGFGFPPLWMPNFLFPFQRTLTEWSLQRGRGAVLADCGLGKTPMQLVWAENIVRKTNRPVLILTPLAVGAQTIREGEKFGIEVQRSDGSTHGPGIYIANYERLHHFDSLDFAGVVCDESSAIKAFNGVRRAEVTQFMLKMPYRLLCTATAAPNDYTELGTSSEALGEMGLMDMLTRFFKNDMGTGAAGHGHAGWGQRGQKFRFKGHAERAFWRWVCSWARACRKPSDLGFSNDGFELPPLIEREHIVEARTLGDGMLFSLPATNLQEEREERRRTIQERCEKAADLVRDTGQPAVIWCHLNDEGDLLEHLIPDARQISGKDGDEQKEEIFTAFSTGKLRVLITKPKIGAWGLNWQHCARVVTFASHSYEQYYQAVRRCWRFGQTRPVLVDVIATEGERGIKENLKRKSDQAERMFTELVAHMNNEMRLQRTSKAQGRMEVPTWL